MNGPLVSILMPVYNGERYISDAIKNVLLQTYENWELIIVDDNSTDGTLSVIKEFKDARIRLYKNTKQLGLAENRNKALSLAKGKYIAILDADDVSDKDRIRLQVAEFQKEKQLVLCGTWAKIIDETSQVSAYWKFPTKNEHIKAQFYIQFPIVHSSAMFRKDIAQKIGGYDAVFQPAEDYDLCFKLLAYGKVAIIPQFLTYYRIHTSNTSKKYSDVVTAILPKIYKREYEKIGLTLSDTDLRNLVVFLNPNVLMKVEMSFALIKLIALMRAIKNNHRYSNFIFSSWAIYVLKTVIVQIKKTLITK